MASAASGGINGISGNDENGGMASNSGKRHQRKMAWRRALRQRHRVSWHRIENSGMAKSGGEAHHLA
jgi:hypothetical protein